MTATTVGDRLEVEFSQEASSNVPEALAGGTGRPADLASKPSPAIGTRPTFTITDAAMACSMSRKTITRKLPELSSHGAAKDEDGVWRIPVEALLAIGLHPGRSMTPAPAAVAPARPAATAPEAAPAGSTDRDTITIDRNRWDDLRIRLARAEAEASERALALADARLALRALTSGPVAAPVAASAAATDPSPHTMNAVAAPDPAASAGGLTPMNGATPAKRRRWWHSR